MLDTGPETEVAVAGSPSTCCDASAARVGAVGLVAPRRRHRFQIRARVVECAPCDLCVLCLVSFLVALCRVSVFRVPCPSVCPYPLVAALAPSSAGEW